MARKAAAEVCTRPHLCSAMMLHSVAGTCRIQARDTLLELQLYDLSKLFHGWSQFNYVPHIIVAVLLLLNFVVPRPRRKQAHSGASGSAAPTKKER